MTLKKKTIQIIRRILWTLFLGLYMLVALVNTSLVQSYLGAAAGSYFSKEWGGKVRIGAIGISPFSHVILNDIELISPSNDTLFDGERITCRFNRFPFHKSGLNFDRVLVRNARYHFESIKYPSGKMGTNLDYIIRYFAPEVPPPHDSVAHFVVKVGEVRIRNVDYIMDLPEVPNLPVYEHGVVIPHMRFYGTTGCIRKVRVDNDSITARIVSLSTTQASGQKVLDISADVAVSPHVIRATNLDLQTADSRVFLDAQLTYHGWESMVDYCNNVQHTVVIKEGTEVNLRDAAYWAPVLWGVDCKLSVMGRAWGPISNLHAENLAVRFGHNSSMQVNGQIAGLPFIENTTIDAAVTGLHTNYDDLADVRLPDSMGLVLPALLRQMSIIDINASLHGGFSQCEASFDINSLVGDLEGQAQISYDSLLGDYAYVGQLDSRTLGLRSLIPNEWVSRTGLHCTFQGMGFDPKTMEATLEARLYNTNFRGHDLARTTLSADIAEQEVNADIQLNDTLIHLNLSATADLASHNYVADISLRNAQLSRLHLLQTDTAVTVTTHLLADMQGQTLDDLTGTLQLRSTDCQLGSRRMFLDRLLLDVQEDNGRKDLSVGCDLAQLNLRGYFQYEHLPLLVRDFCSRYMPTYYNPYRTSDSVDLAPLYADNFDLDVMWDDADEIIAQLVPGLMISSGTSFHGSYNYAETLKMVFRCDSLQWGNMTLHDVGFNAGTLGENYRLRAKAAGLALVGGDILSNIHLEAGLGSIISTLALRWDDDASTVNNEGDLELFLTSSGQDNKLMITKPTFYAVGQQWTLVCPDGILFNRDRLKVDNLKVYGLGQSASIKALVEGGADDFVKLAFSDFVIDNICQAFVPGNVLNVQGALDGLISVNGLHDTPHFDANLVVDGCVINDQPAGRVEVNSQYKPSEKKLYADLVARHETDGHNHYPLEVHGNLALTQAEPELNFSVKLDQVELTTLRPVVAGFSSNIGGLVSGDIRVSGGVNNPMIHGRLSVADGLLALSSTGVTYYFDDSFAIDNNRLTLTDFSIHDKLGNIVLANGDLIISTTDIVNLNLDVETQRILVLDKELNEATDFYGLLLAQAKGTVAGPVNDLKINATASTLSGSEIFVPIDNSKQVQENEFITFVTPDRTRRPSSQRSASGNSQSSGSIDLRLNLHVTPGLKLHLPMDFDQLQANVNAVGRGDIQVVLRGAQPLDILGDYEFTSGSFSLSLMDLITRNFAIEEGSTLNFPGNVNDARFNINAVYNLRANLATLMGTYASTTNDSYVQVQDVIQISGTLLEPAVKFDIRLPNCEQSVSDQVFSYIDRNNELEMLNQSVSLLVMSQFTPVGSASGADNINSVSLITNTAGNIISNMVKVVDVDFNYQASNSNLNPMGQFDVGISKSWNKFYFESTFGYGNVNSLDIDQSNTLVGDVEVGYKFTPYFNFYGFHRTNTSYYTRTELPYKQGVGVELSKDFDSFRDLFSSWFKKSNKQTTTDN